MLSARPKPPSPPLDATAASPPQEPARNPVDKIKLPPPSHTAASHARRLARINSNMSKVLGEGEWLPPDRQKFLNNLVPPGSLFRNLKFFRTDIPKYTGGKLLSQSPFSYVTLITMKSDRAERPDTTERTDRAERPHRLPPPVSQLSSDISENSQEQYVVKVEEFDSIQHNSKELRISGNCAHPCIASFVHCSTKTSVDHTGTKTIQMLCIEYLDDGDLGERLKYQRKMQVRLNEKDVLSWFVQLLLALEYLHRHKIYHLAINPDNILLSKAGLAKLTDFGFAKEKGNDINELFSAADFRILPSSHYAAPEAYNIDSTYGPKADVWSLGVVLYEMLTLNTPFDYDHGRSIAQQIKSVSDASPVDLRKLAGCSSEIREVIARMLSANQCKRPSVTEILQNPFIHAAVYRFFHECDEHVKELRFKNYSTSLKFLKNQYKTILEQETPEPNGQNLLRKRQLVCQALQNGSTFFMSPQAFPRTQAPKDEEGLQPGDPARAS
jgi:serine/threonine protein kinase